jgi:PAS domain S-box-containing protein
MVEKCFGHCKLTEIAISAPILNKDTGRLIGVIVNYIPIAELDNIVTGKYSHDLGAVSWAKGKGTWKTLEIYLVNRDNLMITKSMFVKDAVWKQVVDTLPINEGLTSNKEITGFYRDYRGVEVAGASMFIPSMKWVLLVEVDRSEVLSPVRHILINAIITASIVIILIILLFIGFLRKMVKPIREISDAAKNIARGNFDIAIPIKTSDEISMLCELFNSMSHNIKERTTALVESESRLTEAQRIGHIGNCEWDVAKNKLYGSDEAYRVFGLSQQKPDDTYETFLNCVHPEDREFVNKSIDDALNNKKPIDIEHRILLKDTTVHIVQKKCVPILNDAGKVIRLAGTVQDITERKRAEEEIHLLQTTTLAVSASDNLHDALVAVMKQVCNVIGCVYGEVWVLNPDGTLLERNHAFYSTIGGLEKFSEYTEGITFPIGIGLPGRAWSEKQPVWILDVTLDPNYLRASIAYEVGLKAGIAFPIIADNEVIAIAVFYKLEVEEKDERLIKLVSGVMTQLGMVIKRKQAEDALRESEVRLRSILDNTPAVVFIKDIQGRYVFINRQYEKLFHVDNAKVKGKTDYDLWPKEVADVLRANDRKVIETNTPVEFEEVVPHDDRLHTYIAVKFPLCDSTGNVYAVCGIAMDITERKKAEKALLEAKTQYEFLFEKNPHPMFVVDQETLGCLALNSAAVNHYGYSRQEFLGMTIKDICLSEGIQECLHSLALEKIGAGPIFAGVRRHRKKDGTIIDVEITGNTVVYYGRTVLLILAHDITERKKMEEEQAKLREQLYHVQKLESVGTLAGGIAHDFSNILTAIIGYGNLLQKDMKEGGSARDYVQKILKSAERAANLTQGLLAFSRKQVSNSRPVYLDEIVKGVESLLVRVIREDIKLKTTLTSKKCIVMADVGQMEQVLMNLATNARDAMRKGGFLGISTDIVELDNDYIKTHGYGTAGRYALVSVSDTGVGMDEKTKERIFEPFFTTKGVGKGTGLGLAIVYGIIKQHNGYINVYSEPGKGTTFRIYLPIIESEVEKKKPEAHIVHKGGTETILIAEDEEDVRKVIKIVLEGYGYTVIEAVDGEDAIDKFKVNKDKIHLLLFDVIMPNKNGREAYDAINEMKPGINALFMSGYSEDVVYKKDLIGKGLPLIAKPVSPTELLKKVREALDK